MTFDEAKAILRSRWGIRRKGWPEGFLVDAPVLYCEPGSTDPDELDLSRMRRWEYGKNGSHWELSQEDLAADDWVAFHVPSVLYVMAGSRTELDGLFIVKKAVNSNGERTEDRLELEAVVGLLNMAVEKS